VNTSDHDNQRKLGSLRTQGAAGAVRMEDRFATDIDDLWEALTSPHRLARWLGEVEGDLRVGGEFRSRFFASGSENLGRVEQCEPPRHFLVVTRHVHKPDEPHPIEVWLAEDGRHTTLALEQRGLPIALLPAYGAGVQIHVEDLGAHLAECDPAPCERPEADTEARWAQLERLYEEQTRTVG
jgi:uncharacterized protein YndB with AHSA1/START domain